MYANNNFRKSGIIPLLKYTLIISLNYSESSVLNSFNGFIGMLFGPVALFGLMQLIREESLLDLSGKER